MKRRGRRGRRLAAALLLFGLVIVIIPYLWILLTAFKRPVDAGSVPPVIFSPITFKNFRWLLDGPYWGPC